MTLGLANLAALLLLIYLFWYCYCFISSPLRGIPGPWAARFTRLWELFAVAQGDFNKRTIALHRNYGSIVRIAPNRYDIDSPEAVKIIYGLSNAYEKATFYNPFGEPHRANLLTERSNEKHAARRKKIASLYSMTALLSYEEAVNRQTKVLMDKLSAFARERKLVSVPTFVQYYAFDVIGEITVAQSFGMMESENDLNGIIKAIDSAMIYGGMLGSLPEFHPWISRLMDLCGVRSPVVPVIQYIGETIDSYRLRQQTTGKEYSGDFLGKLLQLEANGKITPQDTFDCCGNNIVAGSDTTAITLSSALYHLFKHPDKLQRLREEISILAQQGKVSNPVTFQEAKGMPYLQAVIKEALRLHSAVGRQLPRVVPKGGAMICGQFFPENTEVGVNSWSLHYNAAVYGHDAAVFRPERWLEENSDAKLPTLFSFGSGSRTCIGKNVSLLEMAKALPQIVRNFGLVFEHPAFEWENTCTWFVKQEFKCYVELLEQPV
ncbi:cytochrome P450 that detoxifies the phytoalexin pisatin [Leptodontidium sp. 2 PMI_412]|nr:cytochrome P450 that detoxifies the phytoalexin pisatin [Leptodontidium sp. 2 PMI_412]